MTSTPPRDPSELMFLGRECHHPACYTHDFLPFSCPACKLSFCQPHFLPSQHSCTSPLPPSMIDRIAPQCPLCNQVVPTTTSRDPNEAVDRHILDGICVGLPGGEEKRKAELRAKKERGEVCWRRGCAKTLILPMKCESCQHAFCPPHRSTQSHQCTPSSSRAGTPQPPISSSAAGPSRGAASSAGAKAALSRLIPKSSGPSQPSHPTPAPIATYSSSQTPAPATSTPIDVRAAAAAAAMKRAGKDVKDHVPFVKTKTEKCVSAALVGDLLLIYRRANSEVASQLQALKNRHDKGLLSKTEEIRYAELSAERHGGKSKGAGTKGKDGCVVA